MDDGDTNVQEEEEVDELQSEEDVSSPGSAVTLLQVDVAKDVPQATTSKLAKMKNAAERTQKKHRRKADESVLQAKREEMGKNKVPSSCLSSFWWLTGRSKDFRCRQTVLLSPGSDRTFQTFCGHQSIASMKPSQSSHCLIGSLESS
jgi:hypothetical protein